jgi:hypothetical protein
MQTYTAGTTPEEVIIAAVTRECPEGYEIECHQGSEDFETLSSAVNQGIDAHLTAIFFKEFEGCYGKRGFRIEPRSMGVLCRRLTDSGEEPAEDLRSAILSTLDIEEV